MLPSRFQNILPAFLTYKKALCKTVLDELRRTGKSPNDMPSQLNEALHLKYERAHLAYLSTVKNVLDGERGVYGQRTITGAVRGTTIPAPFVGYGDANGWCGVTVSAHYLVECLIQQYHRQEDTLNYLLQGTFGQALRADHTRKVARKVVLASGTMSSYAVMNENCMILSWVMLQSESDKSLEPMYEGLSHRYISVGIPKAMYQWVDSKFNNNISIKLDLFHCMRRFTRECVSEHHPLHSAFCKFLSAAFTVVDQTDLQRLKEAYVFCGIEPANPTKQHIRQHCRTRVPPPKELLERVEGAQGMMGVARWNFQRLLDLKLPGVRLPAVFDPVLIMEPNKLSEAVTGQAKYPFLRVSQADTGLDSSVEPGCQPVPLHWDKHRSQRGPAVGDEERHSSELSALSESHAVDPLEEMWEERPADPVDPSDVASLGPVKAGGLLFVLDHSRWTQPMRDAIDGLLAKYHGQKDLLAKVDFDYAALVQAASKDPNSLLHPTTKQHISRYMKHLAKLTNTSSEHKPRETPGNPAAVASPHRGE
ncbi:hypothetical protein ACEWY4_018207 [Coilia grayii]|uniref:Uncharacterized protein n=1 Tax=Coilia grayii TaxID=363190 RepID=A0ABD1JJ29_9TELE